MKKVIVIAGPTGSGKTALSLAIAKHYGLEVINGDSVQIYKELNIGSAKIKEDEMQGIKHHLFDIKSITEEFSVSDYQKLVRAKINDFSLPLIVGGTGFYIRAVLYDYEFKGGERELDLSFQNLTNEELYQLLMLKDPKACEKIHPNNRVRVLRALTLAKSEKSRSERNDANKLLYEPLIIYLDIKREKLYQLTDNRVEKMIENGLVSEAENLWRRNYPLIPIGYRELIPFFEGEINLDFAKEEIKKNTRHFIKRQNTFFNNQFELTKITVDPDNFSNAIEQAKAAIDRFLEA
ncbi:MAG: tRNA (adenosine(37)-N6)-dimethylallyltransferase MiaA [Erysipelotrichales bacterium]|nr:tRNA (adenosine(37)-N6)-dimethylallyltransferase MiaA [Erysipelotrichales bacterium]